MMMMMMMMMMSLTPVTAKLFEIRSSIFTIFTKKNQLSSDPLQIGFKIHSKCWHALITFEHVTKYFIKKGSEVYCAFLDASKKAMMK